MKVSASLLSKIVESPRVSPYAQKLASRLEPGHSVEFTNGLRVRVLQKSASPDGLRLVVAGAGGQQSLSLRQFAALGPVSPAMRRLASFVVQAYDAAIDDYVKAAIEAAGLPIDGSINWSKYLERMYKPMLSHYTTDESLMDDAISHLVVNELIHKNLLSANSTYDSKFNENHPDLAGKALAQKVSAYLIYVFGHRKKEVLRYVQKQLGIGAVGEMGRTPTESIDQFSDAEDGNGEMQNGLADLIQGETNKDIERLEGEDEISQFLAEFRTYINDTSLPHTAPTLRYITDLVEADTPKKEIKDRIMGNPKFRNRDGKVLDLAAYNFAYQQWARKLREFSNDEERGWAGSPIAKEIVRWAEKLDKEKPKKQPTGKGKASGLRLAAAFDEPAPANPNVAANTAPPPPPAPPPAPKNPNVTQQDAAKQQTGLSPAQPSATNLNTAQPAADGEEDNTQPGPKKTIEPEIPGVNHTAAVEEKSMSTQKTASRRADVERRLNQRRNERKFAKLRQIANDEPQELKLATAQLRESLLRIAAKLDNLEDHLDIKEAALSKNATVREKVAARNSFGRELKRIANEQPEELETALNEVYADLNETALDIEALADNLGFTLNEPEDHVEEAAPEGLDAPFDEPADEA